MVHTIPVKLSRISPSPFPSFDLEPLPLFLIYTILVPLLPFKITNIHIKKTLPVSKIETSGRAHILCVQMYQQLRNEGSTGKVIIIVHYTQCNKYAYCISQMSQSRSLMHACYRPWYIGHLSSASTRSIKEIRKPM